MLKILHFADLHLDASFAHTGLPGTEARKYRENLREALVRILELAQEKETRIVTIGGDLYEQERFSRDTGEFLVSQFQRIAPIKVLIAPGNHDPWIPESLYQFLNWPDNVTIFQSPQFTPVQLDREVTLWGMAHPSPSYRKNPLEQFQAPQGNRHLLLFHGSDTSNVPPGKATHAPFTPEQVIASGANLALTGHYHRGTSEVNELPGYLYPGSPEPLGFGDEGFHTVGFITVSKEKIEAETLPVNRHQFVSGEVDVTGTTTREEIKNRLNDWAKLHGNKRVYLKSILMGELAPEIELDLEILQDKISEHCAYGLVEDQTHSGYQLSDIAKEKTLRGEFVRTMQGRIQEADESEKKSLTQALRYGLMAFDQREL